MPLRKSTASTAASIRICGVILQHPTTPQTHESARFPTMQSRTGSLRQQFHEGRRYAHGSASSTLSSRPTRLELHARLESVRPLLQIRPTRSNASAVASIPSRHASFAAIAHNSSGSRDRTGCVLRTPQIAAPTAPHPRDGLPIPVSSRQASRPQHKLSAKLNRNHACLPGNSKEVGVILNGGLWRVCF